jgi:hypothetical protein
VGGFVLGVRTSINWLARLPLRISLRRPLPSSTDRSTFSSSRLLHTRPDRPPLRAVVLCRPPERNCLAASAPLGPSESVHARHARLHSAGLEEQHRDRPFFCPHCAQRAPGHDLTFAVAPRVGTLPCQPFHAPRSAPPTCAPAALLLTFFSRRCPRSGLHSSSTSTLCTTTPSRHPFPAALLLRRSTVRLLDCSPPRRLQSLDHRRRRASQSPPCVSHSCARAPSAIASTQIQRSERCAPVHRAGEPALPL